MAQLRKENLDRYVGLAQPILIEVTRQRDTITYGNLMKHMGGRPGRRYIAEVLEEIADIERMAGRPKLTAVVVRNDTGMVSGGFFGLRDTPNNLLRTSPDEYQNPRLSIADVRYWEQELERLYQYWKTH